MTSDFNGTNHEEMLNMPNMPHLSLIIASCSFQTFYFHPYIFDLTVFFLLSIYYECCLSEVTVSVAYVSLLLDTWLAMSVWL